MVVGGWWGSQASQPINLCGRYLPKWINVCHLWAAVGKALLCILWGIRVDTSAPNLPRRSVPAALCFLCPISPSLLFPVRLHFCSSPGRKMHLGGSRPVKLIREDVVIGCYWLWLATHQCSCTGSVSLSLSRGAGPSNYKVILKLKSASFVLTLEDPNSP